MRKMTAKEACGQQVNAILLLWFFLFTMRIHFFEFGHILHCRTCLDKGALQRSCHTYIGNSILLLVYSCHHELTWHCFLPLKVVSFPRVVKVADIVYILRSNKHNGFPVSTCTLLSIFFFKIHFGLFSQVFFKLLLIQVIDHTRTGETLVIGLMPRR